MTKIIFIHRLIMLVTALVIISCSSDETQAQTPNDETMTQKMYITIGGKTASVTLADNSATQALVEKLQQAPGFSLPTSNERINAQPGDVILYSGDNICIFYGTNSWTYTRLGKIDNMTASELTTFLKAGENNISVTLSLSSSTGINSVSADKLSSNAYTLQGTLAQARQKGIIIQNGKKIIR